MVTSSFFFFLDDWFLEKIVIKEGNYPFTTYTFLHNNWINKHSKTDFTELVLPLQGNTSFYSTSPCNWE